MMDKAGLYVHIPFCEKKCAYCDFCSFELGEEWQYKYIDALISQSANYKDMYCYDTVFVGGGTPTCLKNGEMTRIIEGLKANLDIEPIEFTVEGNPNSFSVARADEYIALGMTRASVGVQSFDDNMLNKLGRIHNSQQAKDTIAMLVSKGISVNCDIMIGLPGDNITRALTDINMAVKLGADHISCYGLIVEEGTKLASQVKSGEVILPDDDSVADIYDAACVLLTEVGLPRYEISNFGEPCKHNIGYWQLKPYLGLGLSAHSLIKGRREYNSHDLSAYINGENPKIDEIMSAKNYAEETMILGLRTINGVNLKKLKLTCGKSIYDKIIAIINQNKEFFDLNNDCLVLKDKYWYCSNLILEKFILD